MIGPLDEFPLHQTSLPMAWVGSSDRNFYDRWYFNAHDRTGDQFWIFGAGYYANLGTKDAFVLRRTPSHTTAVHLGDAIDQDRMNPHVGSFRIEVVEPLRRLRVVLEETEGMALDLTWQGSFDVVQEQPHVMRQGSRITLDAQRFAQVGTWSGTLLVDGAEIAVDPETWVGTRDRSWGIRPVGEAEPGGRPADPPFEGMWWLYVPLRFDEFGVVLIIQESPDGFRTLNDCTRVWPDGRIEQLGWPRISMDYRPGSRSPRAARIECTTAAGAPLVLEVESLLPAPLHVGGGYGGDPDWTHGVWKGEGFVERVTYDMSAPEVAGREMFGVVDHVGRAVLTESSGTSARTHEGWGLFEHGALGRHDPSGFADWFDLAP